MVHLFVLLELCKRSLNIVQILVLQQVFFL